MDPDKVRLTTRQKIKPLLKAINYEIPWQIILIIVIALSAFTATIIITPKIIESSPVWDIIVRWLLIAPGATVIAAFLSGFILEIIENHILPSLIRIKNQYEIETYAAKKEILDNVIDEEVLK